MLTHRSLQIHPISHFDPTHLESTHSESAHLDWQNTQKAADSNDANSSSLAAIHIKVIIRKIVHFFACFFFFWRHVLMPTAQRHVWNMINVLRRDNYMSLEAHLRHGSELITRFHSLLIGISSLMIYVINDIKYTSLWSDCHWLPKCPSRYRKCQFSRESNRFLFVDFSQRKGDPPMVSPTRYISAVAELKKKEAVSKLKVDME